MQDIILASDHRGFELKKQIQEFLKEKKILSIDVGCTGTAECDFPTYVKEACECILGARHFCGIFICGSGIGVSIAANRFRGIRAVLANDVETVKSARQHNDVNVLCLSGYNTNIESAKKIITAFFNTKFLGDEKYKRRLDMIDKM
jgi:ribose 5-phosphate isomerase B